MPKRGAISLFAAISMSLALAGCPTPTGNHRGVDAGTNTCTQTFMPSPGTLCRLPDESCDFTTPCGVPNGFTNTNCRCTNRFWNCTSSNICQVPMIDAGPTTCPTRAVHHGDSCTPREGSLLCPGTTAGCDAGTFDTQCYCTGSSWSCRPPTCSDAGPPECPPAPSAFVPCVPDQYCAYPPSVTMTGCASICICDRTARFMCFADCSADVPEIDASDASDDVDDVVSDAASDASDDASEPVDTFEASDAPSPDDASIDP